MTSRSLLALALLLACPTGTRAEFLRGAVAPAPDDSDWTPSQAPPPGPDDKPGQTPESGFSGPDRVRFEEELRERVLDQVCRFITLKYDYKLQENGFSGTSFGFTRRLIHNALTNRLDLVDEQRLTLSAGKGVAKEIAEAAPSAGFWVGGSVSGKSMVIRRLKSAQTCQELDEVIDLREVKSAIPFTGKRIAAMEVGELWRIPFTMTIGYAATLSEVFQDNVPAAITLGYNKGGAASMTVYRMAEDKLRFRFRVNYAVTRSRSLNVSRTVAASEFLLGWGGLLKHVDRALAKQFARILSVYVGFSYARTDGQSMILEHVVDPRDPERAEAVAEALQGDFVRLLRSAHRIATQHITADDAGPAFAELRKISAAQLGEPGFAAVDEHTYKTRSFPVHLPVVVSRVWSATTGRSAITTLAGGQGEMRFYPADESVTREYFRMPFLGPTVKDNSQRRAEAVVTVPLGGEAQDPILVYIRNQGALRLPGSSLGQNIDDINSVLRLTGAQRGHDGTRLQIPRAAYPVPTPATETLHGPLDAPGVTEVSDRKGSQSFTLVFNQKALREAVSAAGTEVLKAFAGSLAPEWRPLADWLAANGRFEEGHLVYDHGAARQVFKKDDLDWLPHISRVAGGLVADLAAARDAKTPDEKAAAIVRALSGKGESGLSYEQVLRVLVQFVDPLDLTGDFVTGIKCASKGCADTNAHYVLKRGRAEVPLLKEAGETRARFVESSVLYD